MNEHENTTGIKMLEEIQDLYNISLSYSGFYSPISFQPDTNSLNREEHERLMEDIGSGKYNLLDYISFAIDMSKQNNKSEADLYKRIVSKLFKNNEKKLHFLVAQHELLTLRASDFNNDIGDILEYVINFFDKWEDTAIQLKTMPYYKILYGDLKEYKDNIKEHVTLYKKHLLKNLLLESIMEEHSINEVKPKDILKKAAVTAAILATPYGGYRSTSNKPLKANIGIEKVQSMAGKAMPHSEILLRQAFQESRFNPEATSPRGAKGIAQIMPSTLEDYLKRTGKDRKDINLEDKKNSIDIQINTMESLYNASFIEKKDREQSEIVRLAKTLAAYNYGRGNLNKVLVAAKEKGLEIYNSLDWMKMLPKETSDYINKILFKKDKNFEREYEEALKSKENQETIEMYNDVNSLEK